MIPILFNKTFQPLILHSRMQKTLLIAATSLEIRPLLEQYQLGSQTSFYSVNETTDLLITGVGLLATYSSLSRFEGLHNYENFIQIGIAGSFDLSLELGTLVEVVQEDIGDIGAEDNNDFIQFPQPTLRKKVNNYNLETATSISVNTCSGSLQTIQNRMRLFNPTIENMEGYAFFQFCQEQQLKQYAQIRAISNYVEPRNVDNWKIDVAIQNLNNWIIEQVIEESF